MPEGHKIRFKEIASPRLLKIEQKYVVAQKLILEKTDKIFNNPKNFSQ